MFMQNEFEKQVQQKMEELKLVPSDPVWQKVEMQIRKNKDRRRMILWIPLFVLIAGGLWFGIGQSSTRISFNKAENKIQKQSPDIKPERTNQVVQENSQTLIHPNHAENTKVSVTPNSRNKEIISTSADTEKSYFEEIKDRTQISVTESVKVYSRPEIIIANNVSHKQLTQPQASVNTDDTSLKAIELMDTVGSTKEIIDIKTVHELVNQDSTLIKKPEVKKHAVTKWKYNIVTAAGTSGLGRINFYDGQKSLNYLPNYSSSGSTTGGNPPVYGPSKVEHGFSFQLGVAAQKKLGKRTFFSIGLQYNYYSNGIEVGNRVSQNRVIMDYAVSQYYTNQGTVLEPYKNQYHFISVPAVFDWQILKKHPLNFSTGLSLQYLAHTNALRFDYTTQSYFHDIDAFNRTQLFFDVGLSYCVPLKQKPLTFGPQLQYGLTQLEKDNANHHMFSYGLKAQWQLNKN